MKPLFIICLCSICFFTVKGQNNPSSSKKVIIYKVKIYDLNHNKIEGMLERITDSSIQMLGNSQSYSFANILKIRFRRVASTGRGLMYGAIIGGGTLGIIGFASGDDPKNTWFSSTAGEKAAGGLIFGAFFGAIIGGVSGGLSHQSFIINRNKNGFGYMKLVMDKKMYR